MAERGLNALFLTRNHSAGPSRIRGQAAKHVTGAREASIDYRRNDGTRLGWRKRMGIEPTRDAPQRLAPDLKSGSPTSELGASKGVIYSNHPPLTSSFSLSANCVHAARELHHDGPWEPIDTFAAPSMPMRRRRSQPVSSENNPASPLFFSEDLHFSVAKDARSDYKKSE